MAWSREREYACDRVAIALTKNLQAFEHGFMKLAAGKIYGGVANVDVYIRQSKEERGFFAWLSERMASHPNIPHRIQSVRRFINGKNKNKDLT